ncbi:hypothetical protein [Brevibacillus centrosporus]|uniref:hypothetical protein n=1 Tax=Brevibacillus centrosporus TaxID=54910 RepID=UPI002E1C1CFA|nr:hypothetical protein [Brevibacillus centrosporus]
MQSVAEKLDELEKNRRLIASNLKTAQNVLEKTKEARRNAESTEIDAQRLVNHIQSELDESDKEINRLMKIMRNELEGDI